MGQTQTAFLILGIIVVLGSIAYTIQTIEERKRARKLLIMSLKSQIRNALNIYKGVPDIFMSAELHAFMNRYIVAKWQRLHEINITDDSQRSLNTFQERCKTRELSMQPPTGSMSIYQDEGQVYHALAQLKSTSQWLAELSKSKNISEAEFNELGWVVKDSFDRVSCDIQILEAMETQRIAGEKAGFHKFNIALKALKELNQSEALDSQIFSIHNHMEQLKHHYEEVEAAEEAARIAAQEAEDQP